MTLGSSRDVHVFKSTADQTWFFEETGRQIRLGRNLEAVKDKSASKSNKKKKTEDEVNCKSHNSRIFWIFRALKDCRSMMWLLERIYQESRWIYVVGERMLPYMSQNQAMTVRDTWNLECSYHQSAQTVWNWAETKETRWHSFKTGPMIFWKPLK